MLVSILASKFWSCPRMVEFHLHEMWLYCWYWKVINLSCCDGLVSVFHTIWQIHEFTQQLISMTLVLGHSLKHMDGGKSRLQQNQKDEFYMTLPMTHPIHCNIRKMPISKCCKSDIGQLFREWYSIENISLSKNEWSVSIIWMYWHRVKLAILWQEGKNKP